MTQAQAQQTLAAHGAVFRERQGSVDWYWSVSLRTWLAVQYDTSGTVTIRRVEAKSCNCG